MSSREHKPGADAGESFVDAEGATLDAPPERESSDEAPIPQLAPISSDQLAALTDASPIATVSWAATRTDNRQSEPIDVASALGSIPARGAVTRFRPGDDQALSFLDAQALDNSLGDAPGAVPRDTDDSILADTTPAARRQPAERPPSGETKAFAPPPDDDGEASTKDAVVPDDSAMPTRGSLLRAGTTRLHLMKALTDDAWDDAADADFVLRNMIGRGGQGQVWRSVQTSLAREVAVKRLSSLEGNNVVEFLQEAYTSAELDHPNIVPVYDLGRVMENGAEHPLLAMKMVRGTPWNQLIKTERAVPGFSLDAFLARHLPILIDVSNAIAFAHSKGIIHRDLKPHQVMVGNFGEVFLMDWGLAVSMREDVPTVARRGIPKHHTLQTASNCCGTPAYMAPEQTKETTDDLGYHTDIYLLGAILFELVSGKSPHWQDNAQTAFYMAMKNEVHPLPENAPAELRELLDSALATHPGYRPRTAERFREALEDFLSGSTRRRESRDLVQEVAVLSADEEGLGYRDLTERLAKIDRARALWVENPDIEEHRERLLNVFAKKALEHGDLALARAQAERLVEERLKEKLLKRVDSRERYLAKRERQRRLFAVSTSVLFFWMAVIGIYAEWQRRQSVVRAAAAEYGQYLSNVQFARMCVADGRAETAASFLSRSPEPLRGWEWGYLLRRCQMEAATVASRSRLNDAAIDPGGALLAAASEDGSALLWNLADGKMFRLGGGDAALAAAEDSPMFAANPGSRVGGLGSIRFSPDGARVAAGSTDGFAIVWNVVNRSEALRIATGGGAVDEVAFSPSGARLATASEDGVARVWNAVSGELIVELRGHEGPIHSIDFGATEEDVATASADFSVRLWNAADGVERAKLEGHWAEARSVRFSPDGASLVSSADDRTARVWSIAERKEIALLAGHAGPVESAEFDPAGRLVATAGADGSMKLWDTQASGGFEIATLSGHAGEVRSARFSPDGAKVVTAGWDGRARVWNTELVRASRQVFGGGEGAVASADFNPDGGLLAMAGADGVARVWLLETRRQVAALTGHDGPIARVRFSPDGETVATAGADGTARLWRLAQGSRSATLLPGRGGPMNDVAFSRDAARVATAADDGSIKTWKVENGELEAIFRGEGAALAVAFSPDGKRVAAGSADGTARVWNAAASGIEPILALPGHGAGVSAVAFSPDGKTIATASRDGAARLWSAATGEQKQKFEGHGFGALHAIAFSPDGLRLLTAGADGTAKVWDALSGRELAQLEGHLDAVLDARFSADGRRVATSSRDGRAIAWDAAPF